MSKELSASNVVSIIIEVIGLTVMGVGTYLEYLYKADFYIVLITSGALIFSLGSALVKKFPWARITKKGQR